MHHKLKIEVLGPGASIRAKGPRGPSPNPKLRTFMHPKLRFFVLGQGAPLGAKGPRAKGPITKPLTLILNRMYFMFPQPHELYCWAQEPNTKPLAVTPNITLNSDFRAISNVCVEPRAPPPQRGRPERPRIQGPYVYLARATAFREVYQLSRN